MPNLQPVVTTYSFCDIYMTFFHPAVGTFTMNGEGLGDVAVDDANDQTQHDVAADTAVMISKIPVTNGTFAITMQQTSRFHRWLMKYWNFVANAPATAWAAAVINISMTNGTGETIVGQFVSPQKRPTQPYQQQGQNVTWTFMSGNIVRSGGLD